MKQVIFLAASLLLSPQSHADAKVKVFILSGQSNMSGGGTIVAQGTPETLAKSKDSRTAPFIKEALNEFK